MIPIEHEDEDAPGWIGLENCCFCFVNTPMWTVLQDRTPGQQVACCEKCAQIHNPEEVPTKREWCDSVDAQPPRWVGAFSDQWNSTPNTKHRKQSFKMSRRKSNESRNRDYRSIRENDYYLSRIDEQAHNVLLGLDDGTEEAALAESLDFGKYVDEIEEADAQSLSRYNDARRERPMAEEHNRHRERDIGHRVTFSQKEYKRRNK